MGLALKTLVRPSDVRPPAAFRAEIWAERTANELIQTNPNWIRTEAPFSAWGIWGEFVGTWTHVTPY